MSTIKDTINYQQRSVTNSGNHVWDKNFINRFSVDVYNVFESKVNFVTFLYTNFIQSYPFWFFNITY